MKCATLTMVVLALISANTALAEAYVFTLEKCIQTGLERAPSLLNAGHDVAAADAVIKQTRAQVYPALDISSSYTRIDEAPTYFSETFGRENNYSVAVGAGQLLYSGGGVRAALRIAGDYKRYAENTMLASRLRIIRDVRSQFYQTLLAAAKVEVQEKSVAQLESFERDVRLKFENETASEFDWLSARVALVNERPLLIQARNEYETALLALKNLIFADDDFTITGDFDIFPLDISLNYYIEQGLMQRPELENADIQVRMLEQTIAVSGSDYKPEVRAFFNYEGTNPGNDLDPSKDEWGWGWNAGLSLTWSILDGGLRKNEILEDRLELAKAENDRDVLVRQIKEDIERAYLQVMSSYEAAEGAEENVKLAVRALDIARTRYRQGLTAYLEFTDSNLALNRARLNLFQTQALFHRSLAQLQYASGLKPAYLKEKDIQNYEKTK